MRHGFLRICSIVVLCLTMLASPAKHAGPPGDC